MLDDTPDTLRPNPSPGGAGGDAPAGGPDEPQTGGAPPQAPSGGPDGPRSEDPQAPEDAGDSVRRAELDKVIRERQAAKERARAAERRLRELESKLAGAPDAEELAAFRRWSADRALQQRDEAIAAGDVEALERQAREPLAGRIHSLEQRNAAMQAQLTSLLRDQALSAAAVRAGAINPDQVVALLRHRVEMVEDEAGEFAPRYLDVDGRPLSDGAGEAVTDADAFVRMYLSLPDNANLVASPATPGSGARIAGADHTARESIPRSLAEFHALTPAQRRAAMRRMAPEQRRALVGMPTSPGGGYL